MKLSLTLKSPLSDRKNKAVKNSGKSMNPLLSLSNASKTKPLNLDAFPFGYRAPYVISNFTLLNLPSGQSIYIFLNKIK